MQTQQSTKATHTLEELLAAFHSLQAPEKPLRRSQSELALAAVLHASRVVGSPSPQSTPSLADERFDVRSSSLPISLPVFSTFSAPQPACSGASLPVFLSPPSTCTLPMLTKKTGQAERPAIKSGLYKVRLHTCALARASDCVRGEDTVQSRYAAQELTSSATAKLYMYTTATICMHTHHQCAHVPRPLLAYPCKQNLHGTTHCTANSPSFTLSRSHKHFRFKSCNPLSDPFSA